MKAAGLTAGLSPSHPKLLALLDAGITDDELADAAADAVSKGKPFAYALATAEGRRRDSATAPLPQAGGQKARQLETAALMTGASRATAPARPVQETIDVESRVIAP